MSSSPDRAKTGWAPTGGHELPAKPIHGTVAIWAPRIATVGFLGLNLWRAQQIPGLHGVAGLTFAFFGTSPGERFAAKHMALNLASPLLIWTVEGYRAANSRTLLALPFVFGVATQVFGIEKVIPIYYMYSIFAGDATGVGRQVDPFAAVAIFPATFVGHVLPSILMSILPLTATEVSRSYFTLQSIVCYAFYFSPITVSILTKGFSAGAKWVRRNCKSMSVPVNERVDVQDARDNFDLPALKAAYSMMFGLQLVQHLFAAADLMQPVLEILEPFSWADRMVLLETGLDPFSHGTNQGLFSSSNPLTLITLSTFGFSLYTVWDLRRRGYITNREAAKAVLSLSAGSAIAGAAAAYAGLWYWRENILYRVNHPSRPKPYIPG